MAIVDCLIRVEEAEIPEIDWDGLADLTFKISGHKQEASKEIVLSLVEPEEIQALNKEYRKKDEVTDVLSFKVSVEAGFDLSEFEDLEEDLENISNSPILGDIVICLEKALEQAREYEHELEDELVYLFTHGLLHLLGYDHENDKDAERMYDLQDEIIQNFNSHKKT
jgi:probable rRNA maturation factor